MGERNVCDWSEAEEPDLQLGKGSGGGGGEILLKSTDCDRDSTVRGFAQTQK